MLHKGLQSPILIHRLNNLALDDNFILILDDGIDFAYLSFNCPTPQKASILLLSIQCLISLLISQLFRRRLVCFLWLWWQGNIINRSKTFLLYAARHFRLGLADFHIHRLRRRGQLIRHRLASAFGNLHLRHLLP